MTSIKIQASGLEPAIDWLQAYPEAIRKVLPKALNRAARGAASALVRMAAEGSGIAAARIRARRRSATVKAQPKKATAVAWLGTLPIKAAYIGPLSETADGVMAGRFRFPGAFLARMGGHEGVYIRPKGQPLEEVKVDLWDPDHYSDAEAQAAELLQRYLIEEIDKMEAARG
jgi:hypothetical protein